MQWSVSISIDSVHIAAKTGFIACQLENHPLTTLASCSVEKSLSILGLTVDNSVQLDFSEQVAEHIAIFVIDGVEKSVDLLPLSSKPFLNESIMVRASQLLAVLEQDLKTGLLVGVAGEKESAEVTVVTRTGDLWLSFRVIVR